MRVKRFVGENVAEAMGKVKKELGSEAVILQTRQFKEGGIFGFFGKVKVEITAAIEEQHIMRKVPPPLRNPYQNNDLQEGPARKTVPAGEFPPAGNVMYVANSGVSTVPNDTFAPVNTSAGPLANKETAGDPADHGELQQELVQMRRALEKISSQMTDLGGEMPNWPASLHTWAAYLRGRGFNERAVKALLRHVQQNLPEDRWTGDLEVLASLRDGVRRLCLRTEAIQPGAARPQVVALVGPTGVGKTTTIGKLAAGFSIVDKRKVALITADTYRVAAVEQLKTFGEIIGVPVEVAMTPAGLREALLRHRDKDLIFIDTAGRSPHHDQHMAELQAFLEQAQPDQTILVMSVTTQPSDQLRVFQRFASLATHFIFTKLDETESAGGLLELLEKADLPTAYLTNGQNVPDDIEIATPDRLVHYILGEGVGDG